MKKLFLKIISWLAKWNSMYDILIEPKRFFIGMGISAGPLIMLYIMALIFNSIIFNALGLIWMCSIIVIRIWWLEGNLERLFLDG